MTKSTVSNIRKKRIGRPAVNAVPVLVRIPPAEIEPIDTWASKQKGPISRPEAIRRLVEIGLAAPSGRARLGRSLEGSKSASTSTKAGRLARARELAAEAIDKIGDLAASTGERDERRRRLTKGPPEFREHRVDLPKAKGK